VRTFQQQRHLLVDGIVGPQTWTELVGASWRLGDRILYFTHPPMRGDDIATLQGHLNALGFDSGREDGIFGSRTDHAVRAFQKEYGVTEDGIFGPASQRALMGLRVDRPGTAAALREDIERSRHTGIRGALIVVDPGHGRTDPGDISVAGSTEGELCWAVATHMADRLVAAGARVRFTRTESDDPDTTARARLANDLGADLFVSLHFNFHSEPTAEGASTYYFGGSRAGEALAESVQNRLARLGLRDCRSHARSYAILKETRMPAVLVEPAFISNPDEAKRLEDSAFQRAAATAIADGVIDYFGDNPPAS
jgi:N-acetylmuramoyl-L-alanine amidase